MKRRRMQITGLIAYVCILSALILLIGIHRYYTYTGVLSSHLQKAPQRFSIANIPHTGIVAAVLTDYTSHHYIIFIQGADTLYPFHVDSTMWEQIHVRDTIVDTTQFAHI